MIGLETHVLLRHYLDQGLSKSAIARQLGMSRRTIRRWIDNGELDRDMDQPPRYTKRAPTATKLDAFKSVIGHRLEDFPELSAIRLMEEIQAAGYTGGYSQLRDYVRTIRPRPVLECHRRS